MSITNTVQALVVRRLPSLRRAAAGLVLAAMLAASAAAQRCVLRVQVDCSNLPGMQGQGVIDQPRRVEVDVDITKPDGTTTSKKITATLVRGGTARLAAQLLANQVNGQGTNPQQNCDITSTDPADPDWVDREDEIDLKLPEGVKVKKIRVFKLKGKEWTTPEDGCVGHLKVSELVTKMSGGVGRLDLVRDDLEPFGVLFEVRGTTPNGDEIATTFESAFSEGTTTATALSSLADALTDAGFRVEHDDTSLWIHDSPFEGEVDAVYGVWHADEPFFFDGDAEAIGEVTGTSSIDIGYDAP